MVKSVADAKSSTQRCAGEDNASKSAASRRGSAEVGAAVYVQGLARHKACVVRGQKNRRACDFLGTSHPPERNRLRRLGELRLAAAIARLGGIGQTGCDRIH